MRVHLIRNADPPPVTHEPVFIGTVRSRRLAGDAQTLQLVVLDVRFDPGARNRLHTHDVDQVLCITEGSGIVADEDGEHHVRAGDVIVVPAGERHWHGAASDEPMAHLAIGVPGRTDIVEPPAE